MYNLKKLSTMKTLIFSALLLFTTGAMASGDSMYGANTLVFETPDGKTLHMEAYEEHVNNEDIPEVLRAIIYHEQVNPGNHESFQLLVRSLQKPECEEELPFYVKN